MHAEDFSVEANALCDLGRLFGERNWCLATSGNFSVRLVNDHCMITQSGREKSRLSPDDLMLCDLQGHAADNQLRPSAETPLHTCLYQLDAGIGAVLHTHSANATVLSRHAGAELTISGFEMQKAFAGTSSHEDSLSVVVFDNDQDMQALSRRVEQAWADGRITVPGFLIRGHGLTAWGSDIASAQRHIEGFEFLFQCAWQELLASQA
jgi:methylthioribulose-1-phosphate dehydratase